MTTNTNVPHHNLGIIVESDGDDEDDSDLEGVVNHSGGGNHLIKTTVDRAGSPSLFLTPTADNRPFFQRPRSGSAPDKRFFAGLTLFERMNSNESATSSNQDGADGLPSADPSSIFTYSDVDFQLSVPEMDYYQPPTDSKSFDREISDRWAKASASGAINYSLNLMYKYLAGKFELICQLNIERGKMRRKPHPHRTMQDPFTHRRFNFSKVKPKEILLDMRYSEEPEHVLDPHWIIVNASPIEKSHCLLTPFVHKCLPQVITEEGLEMGVQSMLLSSNPRSGLAFNSLLALASVNHLHFHIFTMPFPFPITNVKVDRLKSNDVFYCNDPDRWFIPFLCFQLTSIDSLKTFIRNVFTCMNYLQERSIAHNLTVFRVQPLLDTDGKPFEELTSDQLYLTAYLFPRKSVFGAKPVSKFNPACFELCGTIPVYSYQFWSSMDELTIIRDIADDAKMEIHEYSAIFDQISNLFS